MSMQYYEIGFADGYSICIRAAKKPSRIQANKFCASEVKECGRVIKVTPIIEAEARKFYDFENEANWPVFGI